MLEHQMRAQEETSWVSLNSALKGRETHTNRFQINRERPKSAPYPRLKRTEGLQNVKYGPDRRAKREDPLEFFNISVAKRKKNLKGDPSKPLKFFRKKSHSAEKTETGDQSVLPGTVC